MSLSYYSLVEEAQIRQDELLRAAKAARLARQARSGQPSLLRRLWQIAFSSTRKTPAVSVPRSTRRTTRIEKRIDAKPALVVRKQGRAG